MMQIAKDEFLFRDAFNNELYKTGNSPNSSKFDSLMSKTQDELALLDKSFDNQQINDLKKQVVDYHKSFTNLKELVIARGFKDFGLEGELRGKIHQVEKTINLKLDYRLMSQMLMLRRHEKDYIIRRDTSYLRKFSETVQIT